MVTALLVALLPLADGASDPVPADEDVTAGWTALLIFAFLILAVVVLGVQLRQAAAQGPGRPRRRGLRRPAGGRHSAASRRCSSVNSLIAAAAGAGMPAARAWR